jgi:ubiquinone/menaquinone biosynthesis C-methylase UbiE
MPTRFDGWAPRYDDCALQPAFQAAHHAVLQHAHGLTNPPGRVLDIGCGTGRLLRLFAQRFPRASLVGVDPSAGMLAVSAEGPGHFVRATAEHLPFRDAAFDLVVSTASCRHWDDACAAVREIGRVLKPGGALCVADVLDTASRGITKLRRQTGLAATLVSAMADAGLMPGRTEVVAGFGPVPAITVVVAQRPPAASAPDPLLRLKPVELATASAVPLAAPVRVGRLLM